MSDATSLNIHAVQTAMQVFQKRLIAVEQTAIQQSDKIATLSAENAQLRAQVNMLLAMRGGGPTA